MKSVRFSGWCSAEIVEAEKQKLLAVRKIRPEHFLNESAQLMKQTYGSGSTVSPASVSVILNDKGIDHTIIGAHALAVHTRAPRATKDVDVVVSDVPGAVLAIKEKFPKLTTLSLGEAGVRFLDGKKQEVLDILSAKGVGRAHALSNQKVLNIGKGIKVANLALMLALKYIAMHSETRSPAKKHQDLADFMKMIEVNEELPVKQAAAIIMKNNMLLASQFMMDVKKVQDGGSIFLDGVDDEGEI
jgi:hypothetical protein